MTGANSVQDRFEQVRDERAIDSGAATERSVDPRRRLGPRSVQRLPRKSPPQDRALQCRYPARKRAPGTVIRTIRYRHVHRSVLGLKALDIAITDGDTDRSGHHARCRRVSRGSGLATRAVGLVGARSSWSGGRAVTHLR